jgi:hypothetical protein
MSETHRDPTDVPTPDAQRRAAHGEDAETRDAPVVQTYEADVLHGFDGPVELTITHYRHNLADSEGYFIKAVIDAIVAFGLLPDDNPKVIPQRPVERHYRIPRQEPEHTDITITEIQER